MPARRGWWTGARKITMPILVQFYQDLRAAYPAAERIYVVQDNWPVHTHPDVLVALEPQEPRAVASAAHLVHRAEQTRTGAVGDIAPAHPNCPLADLRLMDQSDGETVAQAAPGGHPSPSMGG